MLSGFADGSLSAWDVETMQPCDIRLAGHKGKVLAVGCGTVGNRTMAISSGEDARLRVRDLGRRQRGEVLRLLEPASAIALTPEGMLLACADNELLVFERR
jgi:WD40 repeat protein